MRSLLKSLRDAASKVDLGYRSWTAAAIAGLLLVAARILLDAYQRPTAAEAIHLFRLAFNGGEANPAVNPAGQATVVRSYRSIEEAECRSDRPASMDRHRDVFWSCIIRLTDEHGQAALSAMSVNRSSWGIETSPVRRFDARLFRQNEALSLLQRRGLIR